MIRDPLTGEPFPNNVIPSNRINPVGQKLLSYLPQPDIDVDNGSPNFSMTDLLPNKAYQVTTKLDHHFNPAVAVSGFVLRQVTHEANANYNPTNKFVGGSYQLDRVIQTLVLNNLRSRIAVETDFCPAGSADSTGQCPFALASTFRDSFLIRGPPATPAAGPPARR